MAGRPRRCRGGRFDFSPDDDARPQLAGACTDQRVIEKAALAKIKGTNVEELLHEAKLV